MDIFWLEEYGASRRLVEALKSTGLQKLYPPQKMSVEAGLLSTKNPFVVAAPTASGKTLIAEMAALSLTLERAGKVVYLVPLRALAREKYEDLSGKYSGFGIKVMQSTGDFDSGDPWLADADILVCTNEKLDSLVRHRAPWLKDVRLVIADEIHLLGDGHRGPTLEVVLTRLRLTNPDLRIIALSATIPNADEIAHWLDATLIESTWRPVPLREGVYFNGAGIFNDGTVRWVPSSETGSAALDLAMDTIGEGGQALIFVGTRKAAESLPGKAGKLVAGRTTEEEKAGLLKLAQQIASASAEQTKTGKKLAELVKDGVAFHHAGILGSQRRLVEEGFKANTIKILVSTTTLAMGLNLPSRRVIIRDWWRYEPGVGIHSLPAIEVKQMSGRAGRPGYDEYGEALLIARNKRDESELFEKYIKGGPEKITSRLANDDAMRFHILASIAGMFTRTRPELFEFLESTFSAYQAGADFLYKLSDGALDFLQSEEMVRAEKNLLLATRFGRRVSELYLDPLSAVVIRDSLKLEPPKLPFPLLQMIARTPDMMRLFLRKKDWEELMEIYFAHAESLLMAKEDKFPSEELLSSLKTASVLMQWILELPEDRITTHFGIGPGDLRTLVELSDWLLYSSYEISKLFGLKEAQKAISQLRPRIYYGVKEELLELVTLRGIGRVRARSLYESGVRGLDDIKKRTVAELSGIPNIGKAIAEEIKRQAGRNKKEES